MFNSEEDGTVRKIPMGMILGVMIFLDLIDGNFTIIQSDWGVWYEGIQTFTKTLIFINFLWRLRLWRSQYQPGENDN